MRGYAFGAACSDYVTDGANDHQSVTIIESSFQIRVLLDTRLKMFLNIPVRDFVRHIAAFFDAASVTLLWM